MTTTARRWTLVLIASAALALSALALFLPARTTAAPNTPQLVKLYEGGKVVAQWNTEDEGRMDGDSFVFTVRKGVSSGTVRIRGTFTAEPAL